MLRAGDASYPELLGKISDPPATLYCRGNVKALNSFCIAIVGTRKASDYGKQVVADMASQLARSGVTVVSGLAFGIDAGAHRATLDAGGTTIAVLGGGVHDSTIGPRGNMQLAQDILASGGAIVSEYEPGHPPERWKFPERNRIISGLSRGVLVIEADRDSGSLITASCALDQDRDVFAIPGSIYWPRSIGTNHLIQQGARPVVNASDIIESYSLRQIPLPEIALSTSDPVHKSILTLLRENGPTHLDAIAKLSHLSSSDVMTAMTMLELDGHVRHQGGNIYRAIN